MFVMAAVICQGMSAGSCFVDVYSKESYPTLEQCDLAKPAQVKVLTELGFMFVGVDCFKVPELAGKAV